ncbi:NAD(P)/FAD-dependent oxidoreductase [Paraferrimonas sedimenticola]|uniref:Amine oxidase n=1 Tax=Paraferrimonas sedimenticola TaxID=375674 RepID=A0AA37RY91_9GAMM|nr:FAD-dependent oxidoreductase [Paraferrimonas sedimenticola]GLP96962.1 amine oxidase [Paraferrimonas sedimenticola]
MGQRIAIIGSGISGLTAAYCLNREHDIQLFEANDYLGGHTATIDLTYQDKDYAIDTGFIVFNDRTYPNFEKLIGQLGVEALPTEMSFSVQNLNSGLEYNGHSLSTLFAQKRNLLSPKFWGFLNEIIRFNRTAKQAFAHGQIDPQQTLGDFLEQHKFSDFFCEHYILPMGAAIWSSTLGAMKAFSLLFFIRFFENHGLLNIADRPQWYVIKGGSKQYIKPLIKGFEDKIRLNTPVKSVARREEGVTIALANGEVHQFDQVVFACHSDQALRLLSDPSDAEQALLSAMEYRSNEVVLHTDEGLLPNAKAAWAAWNYRLSGSSTQLAAVTYNMNILQRLPEGTPTFCVTLNQTNSINPDKILASFDYAHPVFNQASMQAQGQRAQICGQNHTHFCGAYWYNGFHEDGVRSALDVVKRFGIEL